MCKPYGNGYLFCLSSFFEFFLFYSGTFFYHVQSTPGVHRDLLYWSIFLFVFIKRMGKDSETKLSSYSARSSHCALLNPMFNHYGVTMLYYVKSSGNWITLEALVYGVVLGAVMFVVIQWFSCYNTVMTSDKFIYLFGRIIPALSLVLPMALQFVPRFLRQLKSDTKWSKGDGT